MSRINLNTSTNADNLLNLRKALEVRGFESDMLGVRLRFNEEHQVMTQYLLHFYKPGAKEQPTRIYPHYLPTQASGRWSITKPPLTNFPSDIRDCYIPDPGWPWIVFDLDAIEAKIVAAYSHDKNDLEAFNQGYDLHTITACRMIGLPLPPNLKDPHQSSECTEWRDKFGWQGKDDKRRILAKVRYCLLYGKDESAVKNSKYERDMVKQGFSRDDMMRAAVQFLGSKPNLVACKRKWWEVVSKKGEARTLLGRRRKLFGDKWTMSKEGFNHMVQGLVVDLMNLSLIDLCSPPSPRRLITQAHDGLKIAVPEEELLGEHKVKTISEFKRAVEREWVIEGEKIISTATWYILWPDGREEHFK